jgi:type II secretory pathway component PulK
MSDFPLNPAAKSRRRRSAEDGSGLLLVLWALLLLSAAVFGFAQWIQQDLQLHGEANRDVEARAMAHSGLTLALHPLVTKLTPGLDEEFEGGLGYKVKIESEGGKLNIRWLLDGEDERKLIILKKWLELRGLNYNERDVLVDCLLDWVDADNAHRLNGVEDDGDYHAANRPLQSIEEIADVRGSEPLTKVEGWKNALTIYSQGPIDLTSASPEVLHLIPGLSESQIQRFVQFRRGRDGIDGTKDDPEFKSLKDVQVFLAIPDAQFKALGGLISVKDQTMRITSEGHSANAYRHVEVVALKGGGTPKILSWKE